MSVVLSSDFATGTSWLTILLSANLLVLVVLLAAKRAKFLYKLRNVPSPIALPIVGNALQLNVTLEVFFKRLVQWSKEFGDIYLVWVGSRPFIFLYRVEAVQPLLSSSLHIDKSLEYQYLKPWLGTGLLTSTGEKWHARRKLMSPTFHGDLLKKYFGIAAKQSEILVSCLRLEVGKTEFDMLPYGKRAALDMICGCAMDYQIDAQTNFRNEYVLAVERLSSITQMRFTNIWISYDPIFKRTSLGKEHDHAINVIHGFVDKVIACRKKEWKMRHDGNFNEAPASKVQTLLDLLLDISQNGETLSDADIREEVNTFMFAGHDTMGTSISWILYALGRNPEYQDKIIKEFEEVIGTSEINNESVNKLLWLDACIKETWRLYPVAPLIARQIYNPINILGNDIPVGSTVLINSFLLHRDPRHFPQPEIFRPERFLPDSPKIPTFAFIPFSAGSRNCIGWKFATIAVKAAVLSVLRSYRVHSIHREDQLRFVSQLVLDNVGGIRLQITPRNSN